MAANISDPPLPNSYWVLPGELLAGEHPRRGVGSPMAARERLRELMDVGIDYFLDLTMPDELEPYEHDLPTGVQYIRRPIRDHSLPARREHMVEILGDLSRALQAGRRVYVHCHAGIGRTGMVVGCFLVERGESGPGALHALNELWQRCKRSLSWPYVPETEEQIEFVAEWVATLPSSLVPPKSSLVPPKPRQRFVATPAAVPGLRDRFQGALLGLAVGDALAAATQGQKIGSFTPIGDLVGGGPYDLPPGAWSDDTAMGLCLAESLLECDGFEVRDQVERYTRWQKEGYRSATGICVGITPNTARALGAAQWRRQVFAGSHDPKQLDPEVLSRVAPAVLFSFGTPAEALRIACDAARPTCQAPLALEACQLFAAVLYGALAGEPKHNVLNPTVLDITSLRHKVVSALPSSDEALSKSPRATGTIIDVLSAALWAFQTTDNFRDGALRAANLGGHSDSISAAYGQLAGAFYGVQGIPQAWQNLVFSRALITEFANRLFERSQR